MALALRFHSFLVVVPYTCRHNLVVHRTEPSGLTFSHVRGWAVGDSMIISSVVASHTRSCGVLLAAPICGPQPTNTGTMTHRSIRVCQVRSHARQMLGVCQRTSFDNSGARCTCVFTALINPWVSNPPSREVGCQRFCSARRPAPRNRIPQTRSAAVPPLR